MSLLISNGKTLFSKTSKLPFFATTNVLDKLLQRVTGNDLLHDYSIEQTNICSDFYRLEKNPFSNIIKQRVPLSFLPSLQIRTFTSAFPVEAVAHDSANGEETISNAEEIGYRVVGSLKNTVKEVKIREKDVFAVVQIGSHQFKVTPGDAIYTEKLLFADINDKLFLEKVMLIGTKTNTVIGRPIVPDAKIIAAVEEQALDAKVIIFKKKRRKNYRRHRGHRQELTRLRILDVIEPKLNKETKEISDNIHSNEENEEKSDGKSKLLL